MGSLIASDEPSTPERQPNQMCETLPTLSDGSIDDPKAFAAYFAALPEVSCVVMEARWNWGWLYDLRRETKGVEEVENRKDVLS